MKSTTKSIYRPALIIASALVSLSGLAYAANADSAPQSAASPTQAGKPCGDKRGAHAGHGRRGHHGKHAGHGRRGHHGKHGMKMMLKGLDLAEAQRDQIFTIRHEAMPAMRDASKKMRAARKSLRELSLQGNASAEAIAASTTELEKAVGEMATIRTRMMSDVVNVLSEEQASKLRERMAERGKRAGGRDKRHS